MRISDWSSDVCSSDLTTVDPVVVQAHIVQALQTIASLSTDPIDSVVVSITQVHGGDTWNVIPETVVLRGTVRAFRPEVQDRTEAAMTRLCRNVAAAFDATVEVRYERRYPPLSNHAEHIERCAGVAREMLGADAVRAEEHTSELQSLMRISYAVFCLK